MKMDDSEQKRKDRREALAKEYGEIGSTFRTLTDIRFRLLGLLPIAAVATVLLSSANSSSGASRATGQGAPTQDATASSISTPSTAGSPLGRLPLALFGLAVTLNLVTYNKRNDQLYDALVGRAAAIERELGVPDGAFAHRPTNWLSFGIWPLRWPVNHRHAVSGVYLATIALWLFLALEGVFSATGRTWLEWIATSLGHDYENYRASLASVGNAAASAACAVLLTLLSAWLLKLQEERRRDSMRKAVKEAFDLIVAGEKEMIRQLPRAADDGILEDIWSSSFVMSGAYLSRVDSSKLARLCSRANTNLGSRNEAKRKIKERIKFYAGLDAAGMQRYVVAQAGGMRAAQVLALLTDLPPRWLYDISMERR